MRYLLDTNIFIWWLTSDKKLEAAFRKIIEDSTNQILTSVAAGWEISIKQKTGKSSLKTTVKNCFEKSGFDILNIELNHIIQLDKLPLIHKDPFDRILIAQATAEN